VKSVLLYAGLLVVGIGASWMRYTSDEAPPKDGVVLVDAKKDDLEKIVYKGPDLEVVFEMRTDETGRYAWVVVTEQKKKKKDGQEVVETKVSKFKAGSAADKLIEAATPFMAMRLLENVDDSKMTDFGLKEPNTSVQLTAGGKTTTWDLGGETYGTKDRYVRDQATQRIYVVDDEVFKPLKFANSRLPERALSSPKPEEIDSLTLAQSATMVEWVQKNKQDKDARYWERQQPPTATDATAQAGAKDETFGNWVEKLLKVKSTAYVQESDEPVEPEIMFEFTVRVTGKPAELVTFYRKDDAWYAKSNHTRGLVKLSRTAIEDLADEVDDVLAGKAPPEKPKKPPTPTTPTERPGMPPGMAPPGMPPGGPPGLPPRPPMPRPGGTPTSP